MFVSSLAPKICIYQCNLSDKTLDSNWEVGTQASLSKHNHFLNKFYHDNTISTTLKLTQQRLGSYVSNQRIKNSSLKLPLRKKP